MNWRIVLKEPIQHYLYTDVSTIMFFKLQKITPTLIICRFFSENFLGWVHGKWGEKINQICNSAKPVLLWLFFTKISTNQCWNHTSYIHKWAQASKVEIRQNSGTQVQTSKPEKSMLKYYLTLKLLNSLYNFLLVSKVPRFFTSELSQNFLTLEKASYMVFISHLIPVRTQKLNVLPAGSPVVFTPVQCLTTCLTQNWTGWGTVIIMWLYCLDVPCWKWGFFVVLVGEGLIVGLQRGWVWDGSLNSTLWRLLEDGDTSSF